MPKTAIRPPAILGLLLLSASLVSCSGDGSEDADSYVSTLSSESKVPNAVATDTSFRPEAPSLCGLSLGTSDEEVLKLYGVPDDSYLLPGDDVSVRIWEYAGLSVGLNAGNQVVYVEMNSADVRSGIQGLMKGMDGAEAAQLLRVDDAGRSNVITVKVAGGSLKLDLDPDSQTVLSVKLISNEV